MSDTQHLLSWFKLKTYNIFQAYAHLLDLNNIQKSRVVSGLVFFFHLLFIIALWLNHNHPLFNQHILPWVLGCLIVFLGIAFLLYMLSYRISPTQKSLYYFPILCLGFYSSSLMTVGYFLGQMTVLTGIFTIGSIFTGLLLFKRRIIFWGTLPCLVVFYGGSILTLLNILPYAPVFLPYTFSSPQLQNFMLINNLIGSSIIGVLMIILFNTFLGRWMIREENQQQLILLDPLTQSLNRRGLSMKFDQLVNKKQLAGQSKGHICLALLDLDWFKQVNDQYGHDGGDQVLKQIPRILQKNLRADDVVGRFGGEEFMIIFSNTSPELAKKALERCRIAIEQHRIQYEQQSIQITASFGLSALHIQQANQHELIQRADAALYKAKQSGHNNVQQDIASGEKAVS